MYLDKICSEYGITNYTINSDGTVDVDGDVSFSHKKLTKLPLKFKSVSGNFYCHSNSLTSLEGAPSNVGGSFYCSNNNLTSLKGAPSSVGGYFYCNRNRLISLEGAPSNVGSGFYCDDNPVYKEFKKYNDLKSYLRNKKLELLVD